MFGFHRVQIFWAVLVLAGILAVYPQVSRSQTSSSSTPARRIDPSLQLYDARCAGCHGDNLEGGRGPSLVSKKWIYGGDETSLITTIRDGRSGGDMPAFKSILS